MINLIPAEIQRQMGRKGSFFGAMAFVALFGLGVLVWAILAKKSDAYTAVNNGSGLLSFAVALSSIVVGAMAGSYDVDQGIMRYLVMTGRPRWQLVFVRVPGFIATIIIATLPGLVFVALAALAAGGRSAGSGDYFDLFYQPWMTGILYGLLSLAVGMFLKSNGVAIAVAVVLNFAGLLIAGVIYENVSKDLANAFYPIVAGTVIAHDAGTQADGNFSVPASVAVVLLWLVVLYGAAFARVQRTEY